MRWMAVLIAVTGIVMFSAKAVLVKLMYLEGATSIHALLLRMLFSLPFYLIMALIYKPKGQEPPQKKDYGYVFLFGFIGYYLASYFDFAGLQFISASLERIILFVYPTLVLMISALFLKNKIHRIQIFAVLLTYLGVILAFSGELNQVNNVKESLWGGGLILLSALTYAAYLVGSQWLIPKFGVKVFTSYAMIVSCLCVIVHYFLTDAGSFWHYPWEVYALGAAMAVFCTIVPSYLVSEAISRLGASDFAIIAGLGPISTIILANLFLGEKLNWQQALGAIIVIIGVYIISTRKKESQ